jgi:hypothetical protein
MSLERYFPFLKRDFSLSENRVIKWLSTNKSMVSTVVYPCVMFDMDDPDYGRVKNL